MPSNSLLEQALAFYREPTRFRDLKDPASPLGGDTGLLLRLATGTTPETLNLPPGLARPDEWLAAARFFVQQVVLAQGADFYRLHGLAPNAGADEIKEHHRLLMRLVHPDREHTDEAWQTAAAARINEAYATLRDPERRAKYDRQRELAARQARAAPAPDLPAMRMPARRRTAFRTGDTPLTRYLWRHLPQLSLAGTALLALAWVGWIWLSNPPSTALGSGDGGGTVVALKVDSLASRDAAQAPRPQAEPPAPARTELPAAAAAPLASQDNPADQAVARRLPVSQAAPAKPQAVAATVLLRAVAAPRAGVVEKAADPPLQTNRRAVPATAAADPVQAASVPAAPARAAPADPGSVIPLLSQRYERGDLDRFMALFHESARSESGGRARIRKDYEDLFGSTSSRQLIIWDMRWQRQPDDVWQGDGNFQVRVQRTNEGFQRLYNGTLKIEVSADGGQLLIRSLFHRLAPQND